MKRLSRSKKFKMTILSSLFVLISVPMVMYALLTTESADTRSSADYSQSYCTISFPFINSQTVQAGAVVSLEMVAIPPEGETITSIRVTTSEEDVLFDENYTEHQGYIAERTTFTTEATGPIAITGLMKTDVSTYVCELTDSIDNSLRVLANNDAPEFTSVPTEAQPSNALVVGDTYTYQLSATDNDGDDIEYSYSFTPRADWLSMSVVESGEDGSLILQFEGVTDEPASYLANIFIHDGYNQHLRAQSWVISVDPAENDTPIVTVSRPVAGTSVKKGQDIVTRWTATDQNQIIGYKLFYSSNPGKAESWIAIDREISYKANSYVVSTSSMLPGNYNFIVQAQDNQDPAGIGNGVSGQFTIEGDRPVPQPDRPDDPEPDPEPEPDDGPVIDDPQVVNVSPADKATITDPRQIVSATVIAGTDATIVDDTISFKLDGVDMSDHIEITTINASEKTILYTPPSDYEEGEHKVEISFADNKGAIGTREWSFTMDKSVIDENTVEIFGFRISKRTMWIVLIGLALIILAIAIPWVIYLVWRNDDEPEESSVYTTPPSNLPPATWSSAHRFKGSGPLIDTPTTRKVEQEKREAAQRSKEVQKQQSVVPVSSQQDQEKTPPPMPDTPAPLQSIEQKEESPSDYNTITGGIVRPPTFQTISTPTKDKPQTPKPDQKPKEEKRMPTEQPKDETIKPSVETQPRPEHQEPTPAHELEKAAQEPKRDQVPQESVQEKPDLEKELPSSDPAAIPPKPISKSALITMEGKKDEGSQSTPPKTEETPQTNSDHLQKEKKDESSKVEPKEAYKKEVPQQDAPEEIWKPRVIIPPSKSN